MGECIHYGQSNALEIVTSLLIDQTVKSLGHRKICLGYFTEMGVSIQPHNGYGKNAVLDFRYDVGSCIYIIQTGKYLCFNS